MKTLKKILSVILSIGAVGGMIGFITTVSIQIFSRTFLPTVPSWTEELARYLFIYSVAFGGGLVVLNNEYVMVDIIVNTFSPKMKRMHKIITCIVLIIFNLFMITRSVPKFAFLKFRMLSTAMLIPMQYIYFSMFLFFGLQALTYVIALVLELQGDSDNKEVAAK